METKTNQSNSNSYAGLRANGWNKEKIKEMVAIFENLDYDKLGKILDLAKITFLGDYRTISKEEICWTIADDKTYEEMKVLIG